MECYHRNRVDALCATAPEKRPPYSGFTVPPADRPVDPPVTCRPFPATDVHSFPFAAAVPAFSARATAAAAVSARCLRAEKGRSNDNASTSPFKNSFFL